jgi:sucrose-phosphate synthase
MRIVPPGTDLEKFYPAEGNENSSKIALELQRFLNMPDKPIILAISRADPRKNIVTLIEAYGSSPLLQEAANLAIIAGSRYDIRDMEEGAQEVLNSILLTIDQFDLYGKIAYPKQLRPDEAPMLYRLTALSKGVFINPALTEPFGLTLIEAAACGVPIIATEDGGPIDIIGNCNNGYLIDPLNKEAMIDILLKTLSDTDGWKKFCDNGIRGVRRYYTWHAHAEKYLEVIRPLVEQTEPMDQMIPRRRPSLYRNQAIFTDLDQNLLGEKESLTEFLELIRQNQKKITFGVATGRLLDSALSALRHYKIPQPDVLISGLGTEIHYAPNLTKDMLWTKHINHSWNPRSVREILDELPSLRLQEKMNQGQYKISYYIDSTIVPSVSDIKQLLLQQDQTVNTVFSFGQYLDIVPVRASKGLALRWCADQLNIPLENILTAGGSGADEDMMRGNTLAVIVANRHHEELSELVDIKRIYFAQKHYAAGIIEAMHHYNFFDIERTS